MCVREREREKVLKIFRISGHRDRERERESLYVSDKETGKNREMQ